MQENPTSFGEQCAQLEIAIAALEAQRAVLGDAVVGITVHALRTQLDAIRAREQASSASETSPGEIAARLQRHIPENLAEKLRAIGKIEEERRQVTIIFADITGFTSLCEKFDQEVVASLTDAVLRELSEAVYLYEGYVDKFLGDAVMAVFGAPLAHEDDEDRALRAALEMRRRMKDLDRAWRGRLGRPLELHIGVNTGEVIAGFSGLQMSYRVLGDTVNTASRLGDAAPPGKIFVSRGTYRLTREAFSFLPLGPVKVKGKEMPLVVYELESAKLDYRKARGVTNLALAFVGRDRQIDELKSVAEGLGAGHGRVLAVSGEAGIGKSRLMDEWQALLKGRGSVNWVAGRCLPFTAALAYGPFLDLIRRYAGIDEKQSEEDARHRLDLAVARFFPGDREARAVFANLVALGLSDEEHSLLQNIPAKELHDRLFALMAAIFTSLATDCPTVLVIEDLHWADAASFELLEHLFPIVERLPFVIVMVTRPEALECRALTAAREFHADVFTALPLTALTAAGSLDMAARLLSLVELPEALRDLLVQRAEGNPFYVEELIRTLIEQGALERSTDGGWKEGPATGQIAVPDTLHGLLMARLDRLPPETRQLAQRAAVIGRIFLYRVLRQVELENEIDTDLDRMERYDLIREQASGLDLEYIFRHALTQEVAYESLLGSRRVELHRRVGDALEKLFAGRIEEFTRVIGEHFLKGGAWEKAADYLVRSGDAAARLYANAEAREDYAHALLAFDHLPDDVESRLKRVHTALKFAKASIFGSPPKEVLSRLEEAERLAASLPAQDGTLGTDRHLLAQVHFQIGFFHFTGNRMREAVGYYTKVLGVAPELGDPELLGIPSLAIGIVLLFQGRLGKGRHLLGQATAALEKTGNIFFLARAKSMHAWALAMMGDFVAAETEVEAALALGHSINSAFVVASSHIIRGAVYGYQDLGAVGQMRADEATRNAIETTVKSGDVVFQYISHGIRAWWLAMVGRFENAADEMERCQSLADKLGDQLLLADQFTARRATIALGLGHREEARALAGQAIEISRTTGGIWAEANAARTLGRILATDTPPRFDEAEAQLSHSLKLYETGQNLIGMANAHIDWGEICRLSGDLSAAREHWQRAAALFESKGIAKRLAEVRTFLDS